MCYERKCYVCKFDSSVVNVLNCPVQWITPFVALGVLSVETTRATYWILFWSFLLGEIRNGLELIVSIEWGVNGFVTLNWSSPWLFNKIESLLFASHLTVNILRFLEKKSGPSGFYSLQVHSNCVIWLCNTPHFLCYSGPFVTFTKISRWPNGLESKKMLEVGLWKNSYGLWHQVYSWAVVQEKLFDLEEANSPGHRVTWCSWPHH